MSLDKLKEFIREIIKDELEEASTSAATPGYQTPMAFSGGRKKEHYTDNQSDWLKGNPIVHEKN